MTGRRRFDFLISNPQLINLANQEVSLPFAIAHKYCKDEPVRYIMVQPRGAEGPRSLNYPIRPLLAGLFSAFKLNSSRPKLTYPYEIEEVGFD